jgi:hypothetical protein
MWTFRLSAYGIEAPHYAWLGGTFFLQVPIGHLRRANLVLVEHALEHLLNYPLAPQSFLKLRKPGYCGGGVSSGSNPDSRARCAPIDPLVILEGLSRSRRTAACRSFRDCRASGNRSRDQGEVSVHRVAGQGCVRDRLKLYIADAVAVEAGFLRPAENCRHAAVPVERTRSAVQLGLGETCQHRFGSTVVASSFDQNDFMVRFTSSN